MHFLSERGRFTPDGEDTIHFADGGAPLFEAHTEGTCEAEETMRKVYVIFRCRAIGESPGDVRGKRLT
jgi:uncharacterized cupin superfamily protein